MIELLLLAQLSQPVPKTGQCPIGYYTQYGYCVPFTGTRQQAVEKVNGRCPVGWFTQGNYCVRTRP